MKFHQPLGNDRTEKGIALLCLTNRSDDILGSALFDQIADRAGSRQFAVGLHAKRQESYPRSETVP